MDREKAAWEDTVKDLKARRRPRAGGNGPRIGDTLSRIGE